MIMKIEFHAIELQLPITGDSDLGVGADVIRFGAPPFPTKNFLVCSVIQPCSILSDHHMLAIYVMVRLILNSVSFRFESHGGRQRSVLYLFDSMNPISSSNTGRERKKAP